MDGLNAEQLARLEAAARAAYGCELETGLPAALTVAQWALESGWGEHQPGNNAFGIKAGDRQAGQWLQTTEIIDGKSQIRSQRFAVYGSLQECFEARAHILTCGPSYIVPWRNYQRTHNFDAFLMAVAAKYATAEKNDDPALRYSTQLKRILAMPQVQEALKAARA